MPIRIEPNTIQKFVLVETKDGLLLYGDSTAPFHKNIISKMKNEGIEILSVIGGGKIKIEKDRIYLWGKSNVFGEFPFAETSQILKENFPNHEIVNEKPNY